MRVNGDVIWDRRGPTIRAARSSRHEPRLDSQRKQETGKAVVEPRGELLWRLRQHEFADHVRQLLVETGEAGAVSRDRIVERREFAFERARLSAPALPRRCADKSCCSLARTRFCCADKASSAARSTLTKLSDLVDHGALTSRQHVRGVEATMTGT